MELPDDGRAQNELWYSNILCGVLRGALEMVSGSERRHGGVGLTGGGGVGANAGGLSFCVGCVEGE